MAEAIAVGASVIAVIQITDRIIGICKFYLETVRDAPSDLRVILLETSALKVILENLNFLTACDGPDSATARRISGADGPIEGCHRTVIELEKLLASNSIRTTGQENSKKRKLSSVLTALAWPLKENKARKLLDEMMRYKTTISLALTTTSVQDIRDIKEKTLKIQDMLTESQRREVYQWLQHTDPSPLHHRAQKDYEPGTGNWILRSPGWAYWLAGKHRCLWIHGIPGAGKTVLMSYLIQQIGKFCDQISHRRRIYAYYYCYFAHNQDESKPFLKWLISRLCREAGDIPTSVYDLVKRGAEPSLAMLLEALAHIIVLFDTVYIAVDAIDESSSRFNLLQILRDLIADRRFKGVQLVASSRNYIDIEKTMLGFSVSVSMDNSFVEQDIRHHVHSALQSNPRFGRWPRDLLHEVEECITTGAGGMFRWAVCQIDSISRLKCEWKSVQKALKNLPKTLDETYDRVLLAVPEEERLFVSHALRWIAHHNELYDGQGIPYAVLIEATEASMLGLASYQNDRFYDRDMLREVCGCLIDISPEDCNDRTYISVTFAHYTVREYLDSNRTSATFLDRHTFSGGNPKDRFLEFTLVEAQHIEETLLLEVQANFYKAVVQLLDSRFDVYCVVSALLSLNKFPGRISQQSTLTRLAIDLLDPSKPHFAAMGETAFAIAESTTFFETHDFFPEVWFLTVSWHPDTDTELRHLYNLLLLTQSCRECLLLTKKFLQGKDLKSLLQAQLCFEGDIDSEMYTFKGSIVEVLAQLGSRLETALRFLIEIGAGSFDFSVALLLYIRAHAHSPRTRCKDFCLPQRLLELGAIPI